MDKIQTNTRHARKMADDYSYVMRSSADAHTAQKKGVEIRSRLGDHIPFNYMRGRQTPTFLFCPELKKATYEISRIIGESITSDQIRGKTLPEIMESSQLVVQRNGYALEEIAEADETHVAYRYYECVDCYGLPNIYSKIYVYEVGTAAGVLFTALEKSRRITETRCCANGGPYCGFLVEVLQCCINQLRNPSPRHHRIRRHLRGGGYPAIPPSK